jgi:hypothetical protein
MSSEHLASAQNLLKGNLAGAWDILSGAQGQYTDLGIARRFGGAAAAYSLRDIGAMNGRVVKVRRDVDGDGTDKEEDFSANQVQSGALEDWVNGKLESTLPADVDTAAAAYSLRKVKADYSGEAIRIRRSSDDVEVDVAFDSDDKVSASSEITNVAEQGGESGQTTATTLGDFINGTDAFVHTWYDQAGSNDAVQATAANQPKIAENGALLADGVTFDGTNDFLQTSTQVLTGTETGANSMYAVIKQTSGDGGYICGSAGTGGSGARVGQSLYSSDIDKVILTDGQDASTGGTLDSITRIEGSNYLISVNYSNNNTDTLHSNSNANGYANGSSAYAFSAGTKFTIGARDGSTAEAVLFNGSMKEIIAYDSDQSDNRFKIESNINNYYGLYTFQGDGFVETWYDQSGNGNDATQSSASSQPHIVRNGSITTLNNGNPAVFGSRFDSSNIKQLVMNSAVAEPTTIFATYYMDRSFIYLCAGVATGGLPRIDLNTNGIEVRFTTADDMGNTSVDNTEDSLLTLFSAENGGTAVLRKDGTQIDTLTRTEAETNSVRYIFRPQSNIADTGLYLESFIVYNSDRTSDFEDIENDLKRANNIS